MSFDSTQQQEVQQSTISWKEIVLDFQDSAFTHPRVLKTRSQKEGFLRHGRLDGVHFKVRDVWVVFVLFDLFVAQHCHNGDQLLWVYIGDDALDCRIKGIPAPSVEPNGDIRFTIDDTDYKICQLGSNLYEF